MITFENEVAVGQVRGRMTLAPETWERPEVIATVVLASGAMVDLPGRAHAWVDDVVQVELAQDVRTTYAYLPAMFVSRVA